MTLNGSPAGAPVTSDEHRRLLRSIVEVARAIFGAAASSIFLLDEQAGDLIFEAVSGEGEDHLAGRRFPSDQGIAGWVLRSGEPMVVDDLSVSPAFARGIAESTGYVPRTLMASPLLDDGESIGVLEVLDRQVDPRRTLGDLELLGLFANQAAIALRVVLRARAGLAGMTGMAGMTDDGALAGIALALSGLTGSRREAGNRLLTSIHQVLTAEA